MGQTQRAIIGITTYSRGEAGEFHLPGAYVDAVQQAGGVPILLPPNQPDPARILDVVDGLVFSGEVILIRSCMEDRTIPPFTWLILSEMILNWYWQNRRSRLLFRHWGFVGNADVKCGKWSNVGNACA